MPTEPQARRAPLPAFRPPLPEIPLTSINDVLTTLCKWNGRLHSLIQRTMTTQEDQGRRRVALTAVWGNDDAESTIKVPINRWASLQEGAAFETQGWAWYEGRRFSVTWTFSHGRLSISASDGMECVTDIPISELYVHDSD